MPSLENRASVIPSFDERPGTSLPNKQVQGSTEISYERITNYKQLKPSYVVFASLCIFLGAGWLNLWDVTHKVP